MKEASAHPSEPAPKPSRRIRERILQKRAEEQQNVEAPTIPVFIHIPELLDDNSQQESEMQVSSSTTEDLKGDRDTSGVRPIKTISKSVQDILHKGNLFLDNQPDTISDADRHIALAIAVWIYEPQHLTPLATAWGMTENALKTKVWSNLQNTELRALGETIFDQTKPNIAAEKSRKDPSENTKAIVIGKVNESLKKILPTLPLTPLQQEIALLTMTQLTTREIARKLNISVKKAGRELTTIRRLVEPLILSYGIKRVKSYGENNLFSSIHDGTLQAESILGMLYTTDDAVSIRNDMQPLGNRREMKQRGYLLLSEIVGPAEYQKIRSRHRDLLTTQGNGLYISKENFTEYQRRISNKERGDRIILSQGYITLRSLIGETITELDYDNFRHKDSFQRFLFRKGRVIYVKPEDLPEMLAMRSQSNSKKSC